MLRFCRLLTSLPFQSTHPLRGATTRSSESSVQCTYFNPRTPCGVRHKSGNKVLDHVKFQSTHPLRGATMLRFCRLLTSLPFQSTHPLRGATCPDVLPIGVQLYFNPRTPCGVRPKSAAETIMQQQFQSTHPLRGATDFPERSCILIDISIHAPLAGCDAIPVFAVGLQFDFNPRTPCGVRQRKCTKFSAHFAITDNSIGFPRPECRLLGHFLLIPGACSARERVRTFL